MRGGRNKFGSYYKQDRAQRMKQIASRNSTHGLQPSAAAAASAAASRRCCCQPRLLVARLCRLLAGVEWRRRCAASRHQVRDMFFACYRRPRRRRRRLQYAAGVQHILISSPTPRRWRRRWRRRRRRDTFAHSTTSADREPAPFVREFSRAARAHALIRIKERPRASRHAA